MQKQRVCDTKGLSEDGIKGGEKKQACRERKKE